MQTQPTDKLAYSLRAFCEAADLSKSTVYRKIRDGELTPTKCGKKTLIKVDEAQRFMDSLGRVA